MGKTTKPARPKGKAQPASSSRAADLAGAGNGAVDLQNLGGFARFVTPAHGSFAPTSPMAKSGSSEGEIATSHDLSPELVVVIKKLSKRDSITKVRALEEFESYLKNNESSVISILDVWDRLFGKLAIDVDRRVRLATQSVHQFIVSVAKRKIAPHLKSMIGPWLICFFDPSKDVARIATTSFSSAFPLDKKKEVLVFCQKSIIEYTSEMILEKTPDTLSDPRDVTKEEMDAKFARVIIESFHVLAYLISEYLGLDD
ncbi:hypothetical protein K450DRAFT_229884 [Umbelopsis ramanniana AG]|uniref:E3 ubiquitin-protein ligase listerin n=1 Tax=Umbelopsis ramanniana AG TaxID=1314678 RepID=A0AAD5EDI7_UMBRA|nr:uncharacterized protein K450DRAFT_229884 [Umbelopsis ramanniana AG]KAI8581916.1 hypothetical protein K450DRAFT_229884 [Umbelopsis ramanniana AG]